MKLIVKPTSSNLWWGIYGLTEKVGWEDIGISYDNGKRIGGVCLNTKGYLRAGLEDLKKEPEEAVKSFAENEKLFGGEKPVEISFSQEVINELSNLWEKPEEEVLLRLNKALK